MKLLRTAITCLAILAGGLSAAQAQGVRPAAALLSLTANAGNGSRAEIFIPWADVKMHGPGGTFANINLLVNNPADLAGYAVNDASVDVNAEVEINLIDQRIRIPMVLFGQHMFTRVSLPFSAVTVLSFEIPERTESPWTVNITVTAEGIEKPMQTVRDVPRPDTQTQFCSNVELLPYINQHVPQPNADWQWRTLRCEYRVVEGMAMGRLDLEANTGSGDLRTYSGVYTWFR